MTELTDWLLKLWCLQPRLVQMLSCMECFKLIVFHLDEKLLLIFYILLCKVLWLLDRTCGSFILPLYFQYHSFFFFNLFFCLFVYGLTMQHVGSSISGSPTRDWTCTPCIGNAVLTTGPSEKSWYHSFIVYTTLQCHLFICFSPFSSVQFSSVQLLSRVWLFVTPWTAACQTSLSITNSRSSPKLMSIESLMPSSHLILCHPFLILPPIPPSIRVFSNESTLHMRWPKYFILYHTVIHPGMMTRF